VRSTVSDVRLSIVSGGGLSRARALFILSVDRPKRERPTDLEATHGGPTLRARLHTAGDVGP